MDKFIVRRKRNNEVSVEDAVRQVEVEQLTEIQYTKADERVDVVDCNQNQYQESNKNDIKKHTSKSLTTPPRFKRYKEQYPWLIIKNDKGFCTDCTDACERKLVINLHTREVQSKKAWVDDGFSNWKHGADRLKIHSTTCLHLNCVEALLNVAKTNVVQQISTAHFKQMMDNRTALLKIFSTLKALAIQGLPIRGDNNDERSNFMTFL
ncbi:uncharacterized protein LOC129244173 [Anastrepha obliqua]|uniref:uncharacterized protein LOC129244173 n=1 Tax=Anastrepha obliqua TaxID=95512 RepID=UPI00240A4BE4|nr:uncharacterized protein LOC129244173 [Anastrepha obliqua]